MFRELRLGLPTDQMRLAPGTLAGRFIFTTQVPLGSDGKVAPGGIVAQTRQLFDNFQRLMAEAGGTLANVVQMTIYLVDREDYDAMNGVYREYFAQGPFPSRATVFVAGLTGGMHIEITAHAYLGE